MNKIVGRIMLEDRDGKTHATVFYNTPMNLRSPEIFAEDGVYCQAHLDGDVWFYKYAYDRNGRPVDPDLKDYHYPSDHNWDGPPVVSPIAVWNDVLTAFHEVPPIITKHDLNNVFKVVEAAFFQLPIPTPSLVS